VNFFWGVGNFKEKRGFLYTIWPPSPIHLASPGRREARWYRDGMEKAGRSYPLGIVMPPFG
jgi:hypothetical protein